MTQMIFDSALAGEMAVSILVPAVMFDRPPAFPWKGEHALAAAVFTDAIMLYRRHKYTVSKKGTNIFQREEKWIFSDDTSLLFSFVNICNLLELVPSTVRAQLKSETEEKTKEFLKETRRGVSRMRVNFKL